MKNYIFGLFSLLSLAGLTACKDEDRIPIPETEDVALFFPEPSPDPNKRFFTADCARFSPSELMAAPCNGQRPVFEFIIPKFEQRSRRVAAVEVYRSYKQVGSSIIYLGNRVLHGTYREFPATVSMTSQEAIAGLFRLNPENRLVVTGPLPTQPNGRNQLRLGDYILFTFEYILEDGSRVVLTPVSKREVLSPGTGTTKQTIDVVTGAPTVYPYAIEAQFRNPL